MRFGDALTSQWPSHWRARGLICLKAKNANEKSQAEMLARGVADVRTVNNRIDEVRGQAATTHHKATPSGHAPSRAAARTGISSLGAVQVRLCCNA